MTERPTAYEAEIDRLKAENARLRADCDRLNKRDGTASIELCYDDGKNPFAREYLKIVNFGVADNNYVVVSKVVERLRLIIEGHKQARKYQAARTLQVTRLRMKAEEERDHLRALLDALK